MNEREGTAVMNVRSGFAYGVGAYLCWGAFPAYFGLIAAVNAFEVVPWRVATSLVFCALLISLLGRWGRVGKILSNPKLLGWYVLSALLLYANWQLFILGVVTGHVIEVALGYFITPLFTIVVGVVVWRERLSVMQILAVSIAALGVIFAAVAYGSFPWIALGLAFSFGLYGVVHKRAGEQVDGISGLTVETMVTLPVALLQIALVASASGLTAWSFGTGTLVLVALSGVATAVPLVLFAEATRRLPLVYLGFVQFLTPILQFLWGYLFAGEEMSAARWVGFVAVWVALVILIADMIRRARRLPLAQQATGPIPVD